MEYTSGVHCSQSFVICRSGTALFTGKCPAGTRFDAARHACYDTVNCHRCDRRRRQIKFGVAHDTADDDNCIEEHTTHRRQRRQIKFRSVEPSDAAAVAALNADERVRRQIKFRSLDGLDELLAWRAGQASSYRSPRQIKFRSLDTRDVQQPDRKQMLMPRHSNWVRFSEVDLRPYVPWTVALQAQSLLDY